MSCLVDDFRDIPPVTPRQRVCPSIGGVRIVRNGYLAQDASWAGQGNRLAQKQDVVQRRVVLRRKRLRNQKMELDGVERQIYMGAALLCRHQAIAAGAAGRMDIVDDLLGDIQAGATADRAT
jgi:hypothetical protein